MLLFWKLLLIFSTEMRCLVRANFASWSTVSATESISLCFLILKSKLLLECFLNIRSSDIFTGIIWLRNIRFTRSLKLSMDGTSIWIFWRSKRRHLKLVGSRLPPHEVVTIAVALVDSLAV